MNSQSPPACLTRVARPGAFLAAVVLVVGVAGHSQSSTAGELAVVKDAHPCCAVLLGREAPEPHRQIAAAVARIIRERTTADIPILTGSSRGALQAEYETVVVLGDEASNRLIGELLRRSGKTGPDQESVGEAGFVIRTLNLDGRTWIVLAGGGVRGTVAAAGKFFRKLDFAGKSATVDRLEIVERIDPDERMFSQPQKPAQWGNAFMDAPVEQVRDYVEGMAMWGTDEMLSLCAWGVKNPFAENPDPESRRKLERVMGLLGYAQSLGMNVGYFDYPNCVYEDQVHLRDLGGKFHPKYPKDACPSIPEVRKVLLENRRNVYRYAKESGVRLSFLIHNARDFGGCDCGKCAPWMKTFLKLNEELHAIAKEYFPDIKIYLTTWALKPEGRRILLDYVEKEKPDWVAGVLDRPGLRLPDPYISVGWQTIFACGPREVYGKMGADPLPRFLPMKVREFQERGIRTVHTYSEGIYDDINNMIIAQACRRPSRDDFRELLGEYAHAYFGVSEEDAQAVADLILRRFQTTPAGRFNAALRVDRPGDVLATLVDMEERMPPWGKNGWRYRILKARVQLEDLDRRAGALDGWNAKIGTTLAESLAEGKSDSAVKEALLKTAKDLTELKETLEGLRNEHGKLTADLYGNIYGTPRRHEAHGTYPLPLPSRTDSIPELLEQCESLLKDADAKRRRDGAAALLRALRDK